MRCNEVPLKKIDLRERVNLQTPHKTLRLTHPTFPLPQKLRHPSYKLDNSRSPHQPSTHFYEAKAQSRHRSDSNKQMVNKCLQRQDKTYSNNYKLFPKRSFLRSAYVVKNSDIVIDVFSKKVEFQQRNNHLLARSLSLQMRSSSDRLLTNQKSTQIQQKVWEWSGRSRVSSRAESACEVNKLPHAKMSSFTPWQVYSSDFHQQINREHE